MAGSSKAPSPVHKRPVFRAQLDWYLFENSAPVFSDLWVFVRSRLAEQGFAGNSSVCHLDETALSLARTGQLALGQTCGLVYARQSGAFACLGSFITADSAVTAGCYRSLIITNRPMSMDELRAHAHKLRAAINEPDSYSGRFALYSAFNSDFTAPPFVAEMLTGAHAHTLCAVAEGRADIGAIDSLSWHMMHKCWPEMCARVHVAGYGREMPAPPLVCTAADDTGRLAAIVGTALRAAFDNAYISDRLRSIGILGMTQLEEKAYRSFDACGNDSGNAAA